MIINRILHNKTIEPNAVFVMKFAVASRSNLHANLRFAQVEGAG